MKTLAELAEQGLRGKALTDALREEMFGYPPPESEPTAEQRQRAWERFWALQESFTDEELSQDIFAGRPLNTSILEDESASDAHSA